jgi:hypothetical protein
LLDNEERIERIVNCFKFYSYDIKELNPNEADQALLLLVDLLQAAFLVLKQGFSERHGNISICLRNIYNDLPIQYEKKYLFPETKKKMLRIILEKWDDHKCDKDNQRILIFIWDIYDADRPSEEKNIIDVLLKERLRSVSLESIECWITWLKNGSLAKDEYSNAKKPKEIPRNFGRNFIIARACASDFEQVVLGIRKTEIIKELGLENANDRVLNVVRIASEKARHFDKIISLTVRNLAEAMRIRENENKVTFIIRGFNEEVQICINSSIPISSNWAKWALDFVENELKEVSGLFVKSKNCFIIGNQIFSVIVSVCDEAGIELDRRTWRKEDATS